MPGSRLVDARMRLPPGALRVLVVDTRLHGRDARLDALVAAGWFATVYPLLQPEVRFADAGIPPSCEIAAGWGRRWLVDFLRDRTGAYDAVLVGTEPSMAILKEALAKVPGFSAAVPIIAADDAQRPSAGDAMTVSSPDGLVGAIRQALAATRTGHLRSAT
jgi:hypothetical protein